MCEFLLTVYLCRADSSKLLFQAGYIQVLKQMALSGQLQQYNIRSVCWKVQCVYIILSFCVVFVYEEREKKGRREREEGRNREGVDRERDR